MLAASLIHAMGVGLTFVSWVQRNEVIDDGGLQAQSQWRKSQLGTFPDLQPSVGLPAFSGLSFIPVFSFFPFKDLRQLMKSLGEGNLSI